MGKIPVLFKRNIKIFIIFLWIIVGLGFLPYVCGRHRAATLIAIKPLASSLTMITKFFW